MSSRAVLVETVRLIGFLQVRIMRSIWEFQCWDLGPAAWSKSKQKVQL